MKFDHFDFRNLQKEKSIDVITSKFKFEGRFLKGKFK